MFCSNCGKEIADDAKFCQYCGHAVEGNVENPANAHVDETIIDAENTANNEIPPANLENEAVLAPNSNELDNEKTRKLSRRKRIKKQREIEDQRCLDNYTVKDDMVESAAILPSDRLVIKEKGTLKGLKAKEITYIVLCLLAMIAATVIITVIKYNKEVVEDTMSWLVTVGYLLFFVIFFALGLGVDRVYNLMTLNELGIRKVTLKKYGWKMLPLVLRGNKVCSVDISGECDMCNGENRGTYHIEWHNDDLIAVCNYDRKHLYRIDINDIVIEDGEDADTTEAERD